MSKRFQILGRGIGFCLAATGLALGGCASVNPVVSKTTAPVTYRIGDGELSAASTRTAIVAPRVRSDVSTPWGEPRDHASIPAAPTRRSPSIPAPKLPRTEFAGEMVDPELYAHQRVGKRYTVFGKSYTPHHQPDYDVTGTASWYGPKFHGKPTASGETFDMNALSAAHKTLPLHSLVHVENVETGASLVLRVNDRGPFVGDRIIDLSKAAAEQLGLLEHGLKEVRVRYAGPSDPNDIGRPVRAPEPSAPQMSVEAEPVLPETQPPSPKPDVYTPLRRLPDISERPAAGALPVPVPLPRAAERDSSPAFTPQALPKSDPFPADEPTTLTIKGPIHLANSKSMPGADRVRAASTR